MGIYEYAPQMYSPPYIPHTYSYPIHLAPNEAARRHDVKRQDREATETKEETDTRRIEASQKDSKKVNGELSGNTAQLQGLEVSGGPAKGKNGSALRGASERTRANQQQTINEVSKAKQTVVTDSGSGNRVVIEDKQI